MKSFSLRHGLSVALPLLLLAPVYACQPARPIGLYTAPPGPERQLPLVLPTVIQAPPWDRTKQPCPPFSTYANEAQLASISDGDYLRLFQNQPALPAAWDASRIYVAGDQAGYEGLGWRAKWWTQGEAPGPSWGAWDVIDTGSPQTWSVARAYSVGNLSVYGGLVYRAKWWTQGEAPGADPYGPWEWQQGVQPPSGLPLAFQAAIYRRLGDAGSLGFDVFVSTQLGPQTLAPTSWKVHVNGVQVHRSTQFTQLVSDCPPPQAGAPACITKYAWMASGTLPASAISESSRVTVWLCGANGGCRPTPQLWARFGTAL